MTFAIDAALALAAFLGHFSLAIWLFNRLHAVPWPVRLIKTLDKLIILAAAIVCGVFLARWILTGQALLLVAAASPPAGYWLWLGYAVVCWAAAIAVLPLWLIPKLLERKPTALVKREFSVVDVEKHLGFRPIHGTKTRILASVPGNQFLQIAIEQKTLRLERLPPELDGLTIAHLSDLHMTGHLGPEFYEQVVAETNALDPDLVAITGDILEKDRCLAWGPSILGKLRAKHGKYFILGNHEWRLRDAGVLRDALTAAGLTDLGSRSETTTIKGAEILLAGNERPWFGTTPSLPLSVSPSLRLLLSHTPDQLPWACANRFDLMLAGHNHGGQIRLPYLGALIVPSWHGWRYAGGLYHEPPTLLHVTRGLSGDHCLRLNCPPELTLLTLTHRSRPRSSHAAA